MNASNISEILQELESLLQKNKKLLKEAQDIVVPNPSSQSYTMNLLALFAQGQPEKALKKICEEAGEVTMAAMKYVMQTSPHTSSKNADGKLDARDEIIAEAADLVFHLLIVLVASDIRWEEVCKELHRRRQARMISPVSEPPIDPNL